MLLEYIKTAIGFAAPQAVGEANPLPTTSYETRPVELGYEELLDISTLIAVGLADVVGGIPAGARRADVEIENASVRWCADGTDPTTTVGRKLEPGDILEYDGTDLTKLKLIGVSAGAKLGISFTG